jgi:YD repeat-containing protein
MLCANRRLLSVAVSLFLSLSISTDALADPEYRYDEHGRVIMVITEDGTVISYTYDADGNRIRNEAGQDQRIDFDAHGKSARLGVHRKSAR